MVRGLGLCIQGFGVRVLDLRFRVRGQGVRVYGLRSKVRYLRFMVSYQSLKVWVHGCACFLVVCINGDDPERGRDLRV